MLRAGSMETRVYVALGSNVGDRRGYVREAISRIENLGVSALLASSIYYTDPQDMEDDAEEFANAAISFETTLSARELLAALQQIERDLGRPADHGHNTSRTIDLDIILYGDEVIDTADLQVPHPRAFERTFVLMPLAEIAPDALIAGRTARELLASQIGR